MARLYAIKNIFFSYTKKIYLYKQRVKVILFYHKNTFAKKLLLSRKHFKTIYDLFFLDKYQ